MSRRAAILLALLAACGGADGGPIDVAPGDGYVLVTLAGRSTLRPARALHVVFENAGTRVERDFDVEPGQDLPLTFTVTAPGREGDLAVEVEAIDAVGASLGRGQGLVRLDPNARVDLPLVLDPVDFVVNASVVRSQFLTQNPELAGRQLAIGADGSAMIAWDVDCGGAPVCDVFTRRFDASGRPAPVGGVGPDEDLPANRFVQLARDPSIAASSAGYLITWASAAELGDELDVRGTLLDPAGNFIADDFPIANDGAQEASSMPYALADGRWVVVWAKARLDGDTDVLARLVLPNGAISDTIEISEDEPSTRTRPSGAGLADGGSVIVWARLDESTGSTNIVGRRIDPGGGLIGNELQITSYPFGTASGARVAALPDGGFVVVWQGFDPQDGGLAERPLFLRLFTAEGVGGPAIPIVDRVVTGSLLIAPSVAVRPSDGTIAVTWSDVAGADDLDVHVRIFRADGSPCGDAYVANTVTALDQFGASIVPAADGAFLMTWTDGSSIAPDTDGSGVRARYVYPKACTP